MYKSIADYGIIGDLRTIALVAKDGAIDWFCFPHIDSPSVFGALLDDTRGGTFCIAPVGPFDATADYENETNVLVTRMRTRTGVVLLTDFMLVQQDGDGDADANGDQLLFRRVRIEQGEVELSVRFAPAFDYARKASEFSAIEGGFRASGGGAELALTSTLPLVATTSSEDGLRVVTGQTTLTEGEEHWFKLGASGDKPACDAQTRTCVEPMTGERALQQTRRFWRTWLQTSETGRNWPQGPFAPMLARSALVLKLLYYAPSGAVAAAATTSLPEAIGCERNWDYRFTWIRDASFTLQAFFSLGHISETEGYLRWISTVLEEGGVEQMQIMYGVRGERELPETELNHLDGYKGSRPVRIGNGAATQRQLDIYGELLDCALQLADYVGRIGPEQWEVLARICDYVVDHWQEPDSGIWEVRGGPYHFVYSKVMCWVALDRGVRIARRYGFHGNMQRWQKCMDTIRNEVLEHGYCREKGAFVQHYDTTALDASNLLIPLLGFLPSDDPRVVSTIEATEAELMENGLLYRYRADDGLSGEEGTFLLCSFWYVRCLALLGRLDEARHLLFTLEKTANHLGLFAEEYDVRWREPLGNFPQAFTHIGYVNAVHELVRAAERERASRMQSRSFDWDIAGLVRRKLLFRRELLNTGEPRTSVNPDELSAELKNITNMLRGAYFDTERGRVAYERMAASELYATYKDMARNLSSFDPASLTTDAERMAFWVNLYNVIVIHGVIELGVHDSVHEVAGFFRRVAYDIDGVFYTPDDMEHGILRGNRQSPSAFGSWLSRLYPGEGPPYQEGDPRLGHVVHKPDPRIHFALVCASSSCPPIGVYTAINIDEELDRAAHTFINTIGVKVDLASKRVTLSPIFNWYVDDFCKQVDGQGQLGLLRYVAQYLYDDSARTALQDAPERFSVSYADYDWRLNRG